MPKALGRAFGSGDGDTLPVADLRRGIHSEIRSSTAISGRVVVRQQVVLRSGHMIPSSHLSHLDVGSKHTIRRWSTFTFILSIFVALPWLLGLRSFSETCDSFATASTVAAIVTMCAAAARGEQAGKGSLNGWDEALAFNALSLLVRMLHRMQ